jgi:hypothetical protein
MLPLKIRFIFRINGCLGLFDGAMSTIFLTSGKWSEPPLLRFLFCFVYYLLKVFPFTIPEKNL